MMIYATRAERLEKNMEEKRKEMNLVLEKEAGQGNWEGGWIMGQQGGCWKIFEKIKNRKRTKNLP